MFKKTLFVLFSISFHTFTAKIGKRMHSKHPLPSSFAENSWRGKRSDWLTLPFPATKKPKCHQPGINLNSSSPFLISPHLIITPLPPSLPHFFYIPPLFHIPPPPPQKIHFHLLQTKAHRSQDRCALVLNKRSTRSPPSSTHDMTPHITKTANCKNAEWLHCVSYVAIYRTAILLWLSSFFSVSHA